MTEHLSIGEAWVVLRRRDLYCRISLPDEARLMTEVEAKAHADALNASPPRPEYRIDQWVAVALNEAIRECVDENISNAMIEG